LISGGRPEGGGSSCMVVAIISISFPPPWCDSRIAAT
jgi:hypothetical protein